MRGCCKLGLGPRTWVKQFLKGCTLTVRAFRKNISPLAQTQKRICMSLPGWGKCPLEKQNLQVCFYLKFRGVNLQRGFPGDLVKNLLAIQEMRVRSLGWEGPLDKEMTTYSNILAQEMPWTQESGGLQFMGCKESDMSYRLNHHHQICRWSRNCDGKWPPKWLNDRKVGPGMVISL